MKRRRFLKTALCFSFGTFLPLRGGMGMRNAQEFRPLRGNVGLFSGRGGTIGWLDDPDAVVVVDAQFPPSAEQFYRTIRNRTDVPIELLLNTHHHTDHTAGNIWFAGRVGRIVAHDRVPELQRLAAERAGSEEEQEYADTTFDLEWVFETGSETVRALHYGPAHTAGDIVVRFENAGIVHLGDLVFNRWFPYIDRESGGSIEGWIDVLGRIEADSNPETLFVFGHGNMEHGVTGTVQDVRLMRHYLVELLEITRDGRDRGLTLEELMQTPVPSGFAEFVSPGARLSFRSNLRSAWDELQETSQ